IADPVGLAEAQVFKARGHPLSQHVLNANSIDEAGSGGRFVKAHLSKTERVDTAGSLRMCDGQTCAAVNQEIWFQQHAKAAAQRGDPVDRGRRGEYGTGDNEGLRDADVGSRYIGLNAVDELTRLPVVADLASANDAIGIAR